MVGPGPLTLTPSMEARTSPGLLDRGPTPRAGTKRLAKAFGAPVSLGLCYTRMDTTTVSAEP